MTERERATWTGVQLHLLGGFVVRAGERTIPAEAWRLSKARSLVKLLALAPGQRLARDRVLDALWPDFTPETAQNNLYTTLAAARRALEPDATVRLRNGMLALEAALTLTVDVTTFEEAARRALRSRDPADLEAALAHYSGDLLPDDQYEDWAVARREALRTTQQQLLSSLAQIQQERGQHAAALATLQRLLAGDPLNEDANMALMRLYAGQGQRTLAVRQYQTLRAALADHLDAEPSAAVRRLYADIATDRASPERRTRDAQAAEERERPRPARHNLPATLTSFVGRDREVATVVGLLNGAHTAPTPGPRLVTLLGIGGTGKTRLALAVAREVLSAYPDGVWFVDLAPLRDPALVLTTTATVLGVREGGGQSPLAALLGTLRERRLLVVLDNCEHLTSAVRELTEALLRGAPHLQILATSRERLHIAGEVAWAVPPLAPPSPHGHADNPAALAQVPSVRLFLDRVRQHRPDIAITRENAPAVAAICQRLDGLPLALELAAARTTVLSLDQLAARLDDALGLLTSRERTLPERQQTLRATLDWSYGLLAPDEQRLLAQLAVFEGGCTLAALEAVTDADALALLDNLAALTDQSLIQRRDAAAAEPRFQMLVLVREYAAAHLAAHGQEAAARARHAEYFLALAEAEASMEQVAWQRLLIAEEDNLRAALRWAIARRDVALGLRLVNALVSFWTTRGAFHEGRGWLDAVLDLAAIDTTEDFPQRPLRAQARYGAIVIAWQSGDPEAARCYGEQALVEFRALDDRPAIARTLRLLSSVELIAGQYELVQHYLDEAEVLLRAIDNHPDLATVLNSRGEVARFVNGDYRLAEDHYREALTLARGRSAGHWVATLTSNLAIVVLRRGGSNEALRLLHECLALRLESRHQRGIAICLELSGAVAVTLGRFAQAARFYGAAEQLRRAINSPRTSDPADEAEHQHYLALARAQSDPVEWETGWAAGATLPLEQVVTEALVMSGTPPAPG